MTSRAGFGRIIDHLGSTLLDLVAGDPEGPLAQAGVTAVVIHDPLDDQALPPRSLVLGVGVHGGDDIAALLRHVAEQDGAGLVVRAPVAVDGRSGSGPTRKILLGLAGRPLGPGLATRVGRLLRSDVLLEVEAQQGHLLDDGP